MDCKSKKKKHSETIATDRFNVQTLSDGHLEQSVYSRSCQYSIEELAVELDRRRSSARYTDYKTLIFFFYRVTAEEKEIKTSAIRRRGAQCRLFFFFFTIVANILRLSINARVLSCLLLPS